MKMFKYIFTIIGIFIGFTLPFWEAMMSYADTAPLDDNLEPILGLDIPNMMTFCFKIGLYMLIGGISGFSLWLIFLCLIGLVKKMKKGSNKKRH
jgi:hypothetical protein